MITQAFFKQLIVYLRDTKQQDLSQVVITFDVLLQHVNKQCMSIFEENGINSVVLNLNSTAETQPIEATFAMLKKHLRSKR